MLFCFLLLYFLQIEPYPVTVDGELLNNLNQALTALEINPIIPATNTEKPGPVTFMIPRKVTFPLSQKRITSGVIPWSPPQVNWNPWTSCNIDEGPLANVSKKYS